MKMHIRSFMEKYFIYLVIFITFFYIAAPNKLGYYSDDWSFPVTYNKFQTKDPFKIIKEVLQENSGGLYRAPTYLIFGFAASLGKIIGDMVSVQHYLVLLFILIEILVLSKIISILGKINKNISLIIVSMSYLLAGHSTLLFWPATLTNHLSTALMFLTILISLRCESSTLSLLLIFILSAISFWSYETSFFVFLIILVVQKPMLTKKSILKSLFSFIGVISILILKFNISSLVHSDVDRVGRISSGINSSILESSFYSLHTLTRYFVIKSKAMFDPPSTEITPIIIVISAVTFFYLLMFSYFNKKKFEDSGGNEHLYFFLLMLAFLNFLTLSPISGPRPNLYTYGIGTRTSFIPSITVGVLTILFIKDYLYTKKRLLGYLFLFYIVSIGLCKTIDERASYIESWEIQKSLVSSVKKVLEDIPYTDNTFYYVYVPEELTFSRYDVPIISDNWTIKFILGDLKYGRSVDARIYSSYDKYVRETRSFTNKNYDKVYSLDFSNIILTELR